MLFSSSRWRFLPLEGEEDRPTRVASVSAFEAGGLGASPIALVEGIRTGGGVGSTQVSLWSCHLARLYSPSPCKTTGRLHASQTTASAVKLFTCESLASCSFLFKVATRPLGLRDDISDCTGALHRLDRTYNSPEHRLQCWFQALRSYFRWFPSLIHFWHPRHWTSHSFATNTRGSLFKKSRRCSSFRRGVRSGVTDTDSWSSPLSPPLDPLKERSGSLGTVRRRVSDTHAGSLVLHFSMCLVHLYTGYLGLPPIPTHRLHRLQKALCGSNSPQSGCSRKY